MHVNTHRISSKKGWALDCSIPAGYSRLPVYHTDRSSVIYFSSQLLWDRIRKGKWRVLYVE